MKYLKYKAKLQKLQSGGSARAGVRAAAGFGAAAAAGVGAGFGAAAARVDPASTGNRINPLMVMSLLGNSEKWNTVGLNNLAHAQLISEILPDLVKSPNMFNTNDLSSQLILLNGLFDKGVKYELPDTLFQQLMLGLKVYPIINGEHAHEHIHEDKGVLMQHKHVHEHKPTCTNTC